MGGLLKPLPDVYQSVEIGRINLMMLFITNQMIEMKLFKMIGIVY